MLHAKNLIICFGLAIVLLAAGQSAFAQQRIQPTRNAQLQITQTEVVPPASELSAGHTGAVVLKPGSTSAVMKTLTVRRSYSLAQIRIQPVIALGRGRADLSPVLVNRDSLINIGARLQARPELAQVLAQNTQVMEVDQGLIVKQFLSYRLKPGVCTNTSRMQQLSQTGVTCFTRLNPANRDAAYGDPNNPRYIANSARRSQAVAKARDEARAEQQELDNGMAQFRARMKDPEQRAQIVAEIGAAEADRLIALDDISLSTEIINASDIQLEDVMFIPAADKVDVAPEPKSGFRIPVPKKPETVDIEHKLAEHVFITGFTLGRNNEWRKRVSISVKYCVVGCKKTYYLELYAGFGYGLGLRLPVQTGGLYAYSRVGDNETATIAPVFQPINGSEDDYIEAGMPSDQLFRGQELVAELNAYAGMRYKIPFHRDNVQFDTGVDLTRDLPSPFSRGQFDPPAPGEDMQDAAMVFNNPDLLGGLANYGVAGAKILPAVKLDLESDRLRLLLKDNISGQKTEMLNSGQTYPLAINPQDHSSDFSIGYPEYDLAFHITPGLAARLFVDVAVWSKSWDWPIWFPQVSITLPPSDVTFTCHERTICSRDYVYSPTVTSDKAGAKSRPSDPLLREVFDWQVAYEKKWMDKCPYLPLRFCEVALQGVAKTTAMKMEAGMKAVPYPSSQSAAVVIKNAIEADRTGRAIIRENKIASVDHYGKELLKVYLPAWRHDCADQICRDRINSLGPSYLQALKARQEAHPEQDRNAVVFDENVQGNWAGRAKEEVKASKTRVAGLHKVINNQGIRKQAIPSHKPKKKMVIPPRQ